MVQTVVELDPVNHRRIGPPMLTRMMEILLVTGRIKFMFYKCVITIGGGLIGGMEASVLC